MWKPNILTLGAYTIALVLGLGYLTAQTGGSMSAVIALASLALTMFAGAIFILSAPQPNPEVEARWAERMISLIVTGEKQSAEDIVFSDKRLAVMRWCILLAVLLSFACIGVNFFGGTLPEELIASVVGGTAGLIASTVGKLSDPEPAPSVPQSVVERVLGALVELKSK